MSLLGAGGMVNISGDRDPYWENVVALLPLDGTYDELSQELSVSPKNSPTFIENTPWGYGESLHLGGRSTYQHVLIEPDSSLYLKNHNFTIEAFFKPYSHPSGGQHAAYVSSRSSASLNNSFYLETNGSTSTISARTGGTAGSPNTSFDSTWPFLDQWTHVAFVRYDDIMALFMDGIIVGSLNVGINHTVFDPIKGVQLGHANIPMSGTNFYHGLISNFRMTIGVARYTSNFTPPAQPFPSK